MGNETWENDSWSYTGNANLWSLISADEEEGLAYLPLTAPTNDMYGGHRLGDNLFANTLVCVKCLTGERVWHYQIVHHDLWDFDLPAAPILADIRVDGRPIKAVVQLTKQAFAFVFDRVTGKPVWPIEERPVPSSDTPGERTSPTQPFPDQAAAFDRQGVTVDDLIDFTPELRAEAVAAREALQDRSDVHAADDSSARVPDGIRRDDSAARFGRRRRLAGRRVRSRDRQVLYVPSITGPFAADIIKGDPKTSNLSTTSPARRAWIRRVRRAFRCSSRRTDGSRRSI